MKQWTRLTIVIAVVLLAAPVWAEERESQHSDRGGWGVRFGFADSPDQFVFGAQYDLGEVIDGVYLEPNVELGLGDDHTVLAGTLAAHYRFSAIDQVRPYAGAGLAVGWIDHDRPGDDNSDFEIGLKAIGGVRWPLSNRREFFVELDIGIGDLWDAEILAGWRF